MGVLGSPNETKINVIDADLQHAEKVKQQFFGIKRAIFELNLYRKDLQLLQISTKEHIKNELNEIL